MSADEIDRKYQIFKALKRRRDIRELQKAQLGINADPIIYTEIEDLTLQIAQVEKEIKALSRTLQSVPGAQVEIAQIGADGFFTAEGIRNIVSQSGLLPKGESATTDLLLFDNVKQHTWLVASRSKVVIVLDDENTQAHNRLLQAVMDKNGVLPLNFRSSGNSGLVSFGTNLTWWFYSLSLFPTSGSLTDSFSKLLARSLRNPR